MRKVQISNDEQATVLHGLRKVGEVGMRLIDADALADALFDKRKNYPQWVAEVIGNMPEAVVRCKDCKHYPDGSGTKWTPCREIIVPPCWFCADGEKKE